MEAVQCSFVPRLAPVYIQAPINLASSSEGQNVSGKKGRLQHYRPHDEQSIRHAAAADAAAAERG